jgi:predicted cobalt transporter CbtA
VVRSLLIRGLLVGVLAGVVAFAFGYVFGEPQLERAIAFEERHAHAGQAAEMPVVSRGVQSTLGLLAGTVAIGVAFGGLFALVFAYAYGRVSPRGARGTSALLALAAFVTVTVVPFIKYPPNPPAVGSAETVDQRTVLFFAMIAIAMVALFAAARIREQSLERMGPWNATIAGAAVFVALIVVAQIILPDLQETPAGFPADVLFQFRLAALGLSGVLWLTIGLAFGAAAERLVAPVARRA